MKRRFLAMLTALACLLQVFCVFSAAAAEESVPISDYLEHSLSSPDGSITAYIGLDENGTIRYTVQRDNETVILESSMGLMLQDNDLGAGLSEISFRKMGTIDETYSLLTGKKSSYRNYCNEAAYALQNQKGKTVIVTLRCYDDGFAFRYSMSGTLTFTDELSTFVLDGGWATWVPEWYSNNYEHLTVKKAAKELAGNSAFDNLNMPVLYETAQGTFVLLSEAAYTAEYTGCVLKPSNDGNTTALKLAFTPSQTDPVVTSGANFESPWRFAVIGGLDTVVENTMAENLSDAPDPNIDYSFAKAGSVSWSWVAKAGASFDEQKAAQHDLEMIKQYIDLAAEMGWEYYLLDEGWQKSTNPPEFYDHFPEVMEYANSKGIKILVWVHKNDIDTKAERDLRFKKWADAGVAGIKADFFDNENQAHLKLYEAITKECAELGLVINFHGTYKSAGETRTYPHVLTREAIRGQEYGNVTAKDFVYLGYTRLAIGVTDITERIRPRSHTSPAGFQIALSYITCSGLHTMGDTLENYMSMPSSELLEEFPTLWDDTKFIDGYPGEYISLARKSGDDWYASGMSIEKRHVDMSLEFLEDGAEYIAIIYNDGETYDDLTVSAAKITADDTLPLDIMQGGGFAVRFMKMEDAEIKGVERIEFAEDGITAELGISRHAEIRVDKDADTLYDVAWESGDESVASVDSSGKITPKALGKTTVTAYSIADPTVRDTIEVTVTFVQNKVNDTDWNIINRIDSNLAVNGDALTIRMTGGDPGVNDNLKNRFSMTPAKADEDFTLTLKVTGGFGANYQTVALFAMKDTANFVATMRRFHDGLQNNYNLPSGHCFEGLQYDGDYYEPSVHDPRKDDVAWLKLERVGDRYISSYSYDGEAWVKIAENTAPDDMMGVKSGDLTVGVYTTSGVGSPGVVTISDFTYQAASDTAATTYQFTTPIDYDAMILSGDVNRDNKVDVADIMQLKNFVMTDTGWSNEQFYAADVDKDSALMVGDIMGIKAMIMAG